METLAQVVDIFQQEEVVPNHLELLQEEQVVEEQVVVQLYQTLINLDHQIRVVEQDHLTIIMVITGVLV